MTSAIAMARSRATQHMTCWRALATSRSTRTTDFTEAKEQMFRLTDTDLAPWTTIESNDKKRARLNAMRHVLSRFDYDDKNAEIVGSPDPLIVQRGIEAVGD